MQKVDWKQMYAKEKAPPFGKELLKYFMLDPDYLNLNSGSYGSTPRPVFDASYELNVTIEACPDLFHRIDYMPQLREVRRRLANLVGAKTDELVLVTNASMGINAVLRNFEWEEGDLIISFSTTYNSISRTAQFLSDIAPNPTSEVLELTFPTTHAEIVKKFSDFLKANPVSPNKKRVAIIDSIVSNPGVCLPWKELVAICKEEQVWSVIDGAHSIGQEPNIELDKVGPDFWVSNCHKWLSAKRSCAVLYVPERNEHIFKASIPVSHAYVSPSQRTGPNLVDQYEWCGTIDYGPYLTVSDALDFREWIGGEAKINEYCHNLAIEGGKLLAEIFGTEVLENENGELTGHMVTVKLPLSPSFASTAESNALIIKKLLLEQKSFAGFFVHNGAWWTRCSAQVFNDISDFEKMGEKWLQIIKELVA